MFVVDAIKDDARLILDFIQKKAEFDGNMKGTVCRVTNSVDKIERSLFGRNSLAKAILAKNCDKEVIGFALYHIRYSSFSGHPSIWLDDLYVDGSKRSMGFGLRMMDALREKAAEIDASHIAWNAISTNTRGLNFYNRIGALVDRVDNEILYYRLDI